MTKTPLSSVCLSEKIPRLIVVVSSRWNGGKLWGEIWVRLVA